MHNIAASRTGSEYRKEEPKGLRVLLAGIFLLTSVIVAGCSGNEERNDASTAEAVNPDGPTAAVVSIFPGDNWQLVVDSWPEGTTFLIKAGLHRSIDVEPKSGNTFLGERGAVMNGSDLLTNFRSEDGRWVTDVALSTPGLIHGDCIDDYSGCRYPQELFLDDVRLWRVTGLSEGVPGAWYLDYQTKRVYLWDDPTNRRIELSLEEHAFSGIADNVTIKGLVIEKYATPAQRGAVQPKEEDHGTFGQNWRIEENEIRFNHGAGVRLSPGMQVSRNYIHHNGQIGIVGGEGGGIVVTDNEIAFNNTAGFNGYWEAGGTKFLYTKDLVVRSNHVHNNYGPGLWTDVDNINTLYESNNVHENTGIGIQHEISFSAIIRNNVVLNNGAGTYDWLWGAQIMVSGSSDVEVYGNKVTSPPGGQGIAVQQDLRRDYKTRNVYVHHNEISGPGVTGADENPQDLEMYLTVRFDFNTYRGTETWFWNGAVDWAAFRQAGQEQNGTTEI